MKIVKIVLLLVALGFTANALAAEKLACITVTNPDTGDTVRRCMVVSDFDSPATTWSFLQTIAAMYRSETTLGFDYDSLYEQLDWSHITSCIHAEELLERIDGSFLPGYGCINEYVLLRQMMEEAEEQLVSWFWDGNGCRYTVDAVAAASGFGAARLVVKKAIRALYKEAERTADPRMIAELAEKYMHGANAAGLISGLLGIVVGETINEVICEQLEQWLRENG